MIILGHTPQQKDEIVCRYVADHGVTKTVVLTPAKFAFPCSATNAEHVLWEQIIKYVFFYRLLREIGRDTLVVVNECLRTQDRHNLTYNCIRHYLNQAGHQIVFQHLPLIDTLDDFMVLVDFDTKSRWLREKFDRKFLVDINCQVIRQGVAFRRLCVQADSKTRTAYAKEKDRLFKTIGLGDPHTLPRQLHLFSGRAKIGHADAASMHLVRNTRFKHLLARTYKEDAYRDGPYTIFEFPHNFIDLADTMTLAGQQQFDVLCSDLKADIWYCDRYDAWAGRVRDAYAAIC